jgi:hypothetical protein
MSSLGDIESSLKPDSPKNFFWRNEELEVLKWEELGLKLDWRF